MDTFKAPMATIIDAITGYAKWQPNKLALICGDKRLSWLEFNERINRVANALIDRGIRKGDKVSALTTNMSEMVEIIFGTVKAGGYAPTLFREYHKKPKKTAQSIWKDEQGRTYFKTGDMGKMGKNTAGFCCSC